MTRPVGSRLRSPEDAEAAACAWLRYLGHLDAESAGQGRREGVDLAGSDVVAQVLTHEAPAGTTVVQALAGIAGVERKVGYLFSLSGFNSSAVSFADRAALRLFSGDLHGNFVPVNREADMADAVAQKRLKRDSGMPLETGDPLDVSRLTDTWRVCSSIDGRSHSVQFCASLNEHEGKWSGWLQLYSEHVACVHALRRIGWTEEDELLTYWVGGGNFEEVAGRLRDAVSRLLAILQVDPSGLTVLAYPHDFGQGVLPAVGGIGLPPQQTKEAVPLKRGEQVKVARLAATVVSVGAVAGMLNGQAQWRLEVIDVEKPTVRMWLPAMAAFDRRKDRQWDAKKATLDVAARQAVVWLVSLSKGVSALEGMTVELDPRV